MSETSDDALLSPAQARRNQRRSMRRTSPTPDLVTSLVRPPSPSDAFIITASQLHSHTRAALPIRSLDGVARPPPLPNSRRSSGAIRFPHQSSLDIPDKYGGACVFDMYSLTYVAEPDPNLLCPICHDPLIDPVTTPCDHTFCYRCLRRTIATSAAGTTCPIDREPLNWLECASAARLIRTQLNNMVVKCPNHTRGCTRETKREAVEAHASTECDFRHYFCPDASCDKKLKFKPKDDACAHHDIQCIHCDATIQKADSVVHMLSCPRSKTRCDACWRLVYRDRLQGHKDDECDGVEVGCPYHDVGCPVRTMRGQVRLHTLECPFHPETASGIVIRSQRDVIKSYGDLSNQLRDMQAQQDENKKRIEQLEGMVPLRNRREGSDGVFHDQRTMQDLDAGFEEIHQSLTQLEARQSMWTLNQVMLVREEVTELRNNINMVRMYVNLLLNRNREEGRMRAANSSESPSSVRRDSSGEPAPMLSERRRMSSTDIDQPRL